MFVRTVALVAAVVVLVAGCADTAKPPPVTTTPKPDSIIRLVNLNAAMGFKMGEGDPAGTDATPEDIAFLADDIVRQNGDIAHLQEMALPAAQELRTVLAKKTGDEWQLNWAKSGTATYYPGKDKNEAPSPGYDNTQSGNAQLVRIGDGIRAQKAITLDDADNEQGMVLPSGGRSFLGAEITTANGTINIYNTHLALAEVPDDVRAKDVQHIQAFTEARATPTVLTGDFNQTVDFVAGQPYPYRLTVDAIRAFTHDYGYTDVARDKGPTSNEKRKALGPKRIDFILARGVLASDTERFVSHESDHWGLVTTIAPDTGAPSDPPPSPSTSTTTTTTPAPAGPTVAGAIQRYETYLHAVGAEDLATVCDIAGPAAKQAEDEGFGPCETTMPMMFQMISPAQKQALTTATVDPAQVTGGGTRVEIPTAAIRASVVFTSSDLGDSTLDYLDGQWYVTD